MTAVSLEKLTKVYPTGVHAVEALDLTIGDGEFVVLVGPSGCGKTTALRMVAGLEKITSGTLRFGDQIVNNVPPRHRDVAMVFQNYALYPHLSVRDNIGFALVNKKVPKPERDRRIDAAAGILGLTGLLDRRPAHLSGGQRQRVAMGRAIVREPAVFLMDEPLSNLDAKLRVQMRAEVLRVHRSIGAATLYVTHDQTEAMTMGDRVAVLRAGRLQQCGPPRHLYKAPANLFVATFIGSPEMNLYEAGIGAAGDATVVALGTQRLTLPARLLAGRPGLAAYRDRKVVVGIRPEDLLVPAASPDTATSHQAAPQNRSGSVAADDPEMRHTLTAEVRLVEPLGSEQLVHFTVDATQFRLHADGTADNQIGEGELVAAIANGVARIGSHTPIRPGEPVVFTVDPARLHFFDPDTGTAVI